MAKKLLENFIKKNIRNFVISGIFLSAIFGLWIWQNSVVAASAPSIVTYQGKLLISNSPASTTVSMKFVLYDALTAGSALYTASGTLPTTSTISVTPTSGVFSVDLGGTGTNALDPTIFQNNQSVYLEVTVGSQTLTPRKQITAAPYAFNTKYIDGLATSSLAKVATDETITGGWTFSSTTALATTTITGRLGIGTTTPDQELTVVGSISNPVNGNSGITQIATTSVGSAPWSIAVFARYAYVANSNDNTISIVDISNPSVPAQIAITAVGVSPQSIAVSGRYAYVTNIDGGTISVVDISNPSAPIQIAITAVGNQPQYIAVSGRYAYVANFLDNTISVVDISNPSAPIQIAITAVGVSPQSIAVSGRYAYVASYAENIISIVDISNPFAPIQTSTAAVGSAPISIAVSGRYAYVANSNDNTISIVDISNSSAPIQIATTAVGNQPQYIAVSGRYAYVANYGDNTISVIDISGAEFSTLIAHSAEAGQLQVRNDIIAQGVIQAGTSLQVGAGGILSNGSIAITATNTYSYFGGGITVSGMTTSTNLSVIGTSTLRNILPDTTGGSGNMSLYSIGDTSHRWLNVWAQYYNIGTSTYSLNANNGAFSITDSASGAGNNRFTINSSGFVGIGTTTPLSKLSVSGDLFLDGSNRYLNFGSATGTSGYGIYDNSGILQFKNSGGTWTNIPTSTLPSATDGQTMYYAGSTWTATSALYISSSTGRIGIGTTTPDQALTVVGSISNNLNSNSNIQLVSSVLLSDTPYEVTVSGRYAYVVINSATGILKVVDVSSPSLPSVVTSTALGMEGAYSIAVSGRYAYIGGYPGAFAVVDISNPSNPQVLSTTTIGNTTGVTSQPLSVSIYGDYAILGNSNSDDFAIVDIHDPMAPSLITTSSIWGNNPSDLMIQGRYLYVAEYDYDNISIYDLINPVSPNLVGTSTVGAGAGPVGIFVSGRYAYTVNQSNDSISVIDVSNPADPSFVASAVVGNYPQDIYVTGRYAYVANSASDTISIVDVSNPSAPSQLSTFAAGDQPVSIFVSGRYAYVADMAGLSLSILDLTGTEVGTLIAHSAEAGQLQVRNDIIAQGIIVAGTSLQVGMGGILSNGSIAITATNTYSYFGGSLTVASSTALSTTTVSQFLGVGTTNPGTQLTVKDTGFSSLTSSSLKQSLLSVDQVALSQLEGGGYFGRIGMLSSPWQLAFNDNWVATSLPAGLAGGAISGNGKYIIGLLPGYNIVTSSDFLNTPNFGLGAQNFKATAISADGKVAVVAIGGGGILISKNYLDTWTATGASSLSWQSVAMSADGKRITAVATGGDIYTSSDFGTTWNARSMSGYNWTGVAMSSDGQIQVAVASSTGNLYRSVNYGLTWTAVTNAGTRDWQGVAMSDDAHFQLAASSDDGVYYSRDYGVTWDNVAPGTGWYGVAMSGNGAIQIAVINGGGVYYTDDYGTNWEQTGLTDDDWVGVSISADGSFAITASTANTLGVNRADSYLMTSHLGINTADFSQNKRFTVDGDGLFTSDLSITGTTTIGSNLLVSGRGNFGTLTVNGTITLSDLSFATGTTFTVNAPMVTGAVGITINSNFGGTESDRYILSLRASNNKVFSVSANGDVRALGTVYASSSAVGTPGTPGDLAERVDIATDDTVEAGDVMVVDQYSVDTYRRSQKSYESAVAGVISTQPTITVGNGKTNYTAVMAMVGRVPVKVSGENGAIMRGDLLVSASLSGYAMRYDSGKDNSQAVGVIGIALDNFDGNGTGKIMSLIRTGWVSNSSQTIILIQDKLDQLVAAQGININSNVEQLNVVQNSNGQIAYTGGDFNLFGSNILNVSAIYGTGGRWAIDVDGRFVSTVATPGGQTELRGMQSPSLELIFSGEGQLENGMATIAFDNDTQSLIDDSQPIKVSITLTSGQTAGVYIDEKNYQGFVVKELNNGTGNATFDWVVMSKRRDKQVAVPQDIVSVTTTVGSEETVLNFEDGSISETTTNLDIFTDQVTPTTTVEVSSTTVEQEEVVVTSTENVDVVESATDAAVLEEQVSETFSDNTGGNQTTSTTDLVP